MKLEERNLAFSYPGEKRLVFEDKSLSIDSGERVALAAP